MPFVLFMEADEETMISRIMERSKTSGRNDDNIEALRKRFATFRNESMPIITKYEAMGKVRRIDGLKPIDDVFAEVERTFKDYI
jgi:UMP-CMP kinase